MRKILNKFFGSEIYICLIFLLAFLNWIKFIDYKILLPILTIIILLYCISCRDSKGLIPIIISLLISNIFAFDNNSPEIGDTVKNLNFILIGICASIALIALIYFYIKNRRTYSKISVLGLSLVGIFISFTLSDIFKSKSIDFINIGLVVLLFYFIRHTIDYYKMKESFLPYFSKTMFYFGITIAIQIITYYALNFTLDSPISFGPELGWANHNGVSMLLILIIPIASYTLFYTQNPGYFVGLLILISANLLTTSRGGILAMVIMIPLLIINNYRKYHSRRQFFQGLVITIIYFVVIFIAFTPYFIKVLQMLFYDGLNDSGRFNLWREAFEIFKNNIFLGGGSNIFPINGSLWRPWFHSTLFDIIGQLGLVGLLTFTIHFIIKYVYIFTDRSTYKWFVLAGFLSSGFYGMIDVAYFNFQYLIIYIIILATIEYSSGYLTHTRKD